MPISSDKTLRRLVADYRWGDVAKAVIRRDGREMPLDINFRRAAQ
jgi:S1-C subfamily serine protease